MSITEFLEIPVALSKLMFSPLSSGLLRVRTSWNQAQGTWTGTVGRGWDEVLRVSTHPGRWP